MCSWCQPSPEGRGWPAAGALTSPSADGAGVTWERLEHQSEAIVKRTVLFLRRFGGSDFNLIGWNGPGLLNLQIRVEFRSAARQAKFQRSKFALSAHNQVTFGFLPRLNLLNRTPRIKRPVACP